MLFTSLHFTVFFPIVVVMYFATPYRYRWVLLLAASYYFYMCWKASYVILIVASTLIDYVAALLMAQAPTKAKRRKYLLLSLAANLSLLFVFKYFNFFRESLDVILSFYHLPVPPALDVLLPVGISFYTFQTLSYSIDVYRGEREPERHLGYFALYVTFFPQLVAGPIERSTRLLPQFFEKHDVDWDRIRSGLLLMVIGFFKKLVIADRVAVFVDAVYNNPEQYHGFPIAVATYLFAFQIFCDFSGYSDIAIGSARVMGFELMENFRAPYLARNMSDFWRRWHISLSTWMRDYLYISLGGNRVSSARRWANIMITFLLSGLWHGANWTFLAWGFIHAIYLTVGQATADLRARMRVFIGLSRAPILEHVVQIVVTFHLVVLAWMLFRANSIVDVYTLLRGMAQDFSLTDPTIFEIMKPREFWTAIAAIAAMTVLQIVNAKYPLQSGLFRMPLPVRWATYYALALGTVALGAFTGEAFIYFQF